MDGIVVADGNVVAAAGRMNGATTTNYGYPQFIQYREEVLRISRPQNVLGSAFGMNFHEQEWFQAPYTNRAALSQDYNPCSSQDRSDSTPFIHEMPNTSEKAEEVKVLEDPVLGYISEILMKDQDAEDQNCVESNKTSYQAIAKELSDLVMNSSNCSSDHSQGSYNSRNMEMDTQQKDNYCQRSKTGKLHSTLGDDQTCQKTADQVLLHVMLVECAKSIAANDTEKAYAVIEELRKFGSPRGDIHQRLTHYFTEGLAARITGTGYLLYTAMAMDRPSEEEMLKAYRLYASHCPHARLSHFFSNQIILDASHNAKRLHVVDFGIQYGFQWLCLIKALASRSIAPPQLRITAVDFPHPGTRPAQMVEETGRRLQEYARSLNVELEYRPMAIRWQDFLPASVARQPGELLVVNCLFGLRHLVDDNLQLPADDACSARRSLLTKIRSMQPAVVVQGVWNASCNSPFFMTRLLQALSHYGAVFDAVDVSIPRPRLQRLVVEQQLWGREILNIVACEGEERVERPESYRRWQEIVSSAGYEQLPLAPHIYNKARGMLASFHKDHAIAQDANWLLHGWKNRVLHAFATWRPTRI